MKIFRKMSALRPARKPICLAAGFFDGLHAGHQEVLRRALDRAREIGGEAWAITFDPHPLKVLHPLDAPPMLTSTPHKLDLMRRFGMDGCLLIPFTRAFSKTTASAFLETLRTSIPTLSEIFVGEDWRFGRGGQGDTALLAAWASPLGIRVSRVILVQRHSGLVSSTRIRAALSAGRLTLAARLIGRPFSILGTVVTGNRIGRKLGFPTANLTPHNEAHPPLGIYAVQAIVGRRAYAGVVSFGFHPTVKPASAPLLEVHLLDTRQPLYGREIEVFFIKRIRQERRFASLTQLVTQIRRDVQAARRLLKTKSAQKLWNNTLQTWYPETIVPQKESVRESRKGMELR